MKYKVSIFLFIIVVFTFWCFNHWLPNVMDDELYARIYPAEQIDNGHPHCLETDKKIGSYLDVWTSQTHHYLTKNGRAPIHIIAQCFLGLWGQTFFDLINPLFLVLFLLLLSLIIVPNCERKMRLWWMMTLGWAFAVLLPEPTAFYNGIDYSINYLWATSVCLVFIWLAFKDEPNTIIPIVVQCVFAFLAGWSHEGFVIPIGAGAMTYACLHKFRFKKKHWILFICFGLGALLLILSPGNFRRVGDGLGNRNAMFQYLRASYILVALLMCLIVKYRTNIIERLKSEWVYLSMWIAAIVFIMMIGVLNERSVIGIDFFAFISLFRLICPKLYKYQSISQVGAMLFVGGILCIMPFQYAAAMQYQTMHNTLAENQNRECVVSVDQLKVPWWLHRYVCQYHFDELWFDWEERTFGLAYDKDNLIFCEDSFGEKSVYIEDYFNDVHKFPGDNPFYKIGNWLYSREVLPTNVAAVYSLGTRDSYDITSTIKKVVALFLPEQGNVQPVVLVVEPFEMQGKTYYRTYLYPHQTRKIESITIKQ